MFSTFCGKLSDRQFGRRFEASPQGNCCFRVQEKLFHSFCLCNRIDLISLQTKKRCPTKKLGSAFLFVFELKRRVSSLWAFYPLAHLQSSVQPLPSFAL